MTAPDKIWVNADDNTDGCCPVETDLDDVGKFFDVGQAVEYTRSDLIAARAVGEAVAWRWHWTGGDEPDVWGYSATRMVSDKHVIVEPLYLHPASPLGAVEMRDKAIELMKPEILKAAGEEYVLEHVMETDWHRQGRHSAVRGMMVRLGLYAELEAAIDAALARKGE